jgi:cell division protein FtsI/penicillin-binding protein 2
MCFSGLAGIGVQADAPQPAAAAPVATELPSVPAELPAPSADGLIYLPGAPGAAPRATTIDPALQAHLTQFLVDNHTPIAAVVVADARTGAILAMAQGRAPQTWGAKGHTALHTGFPAASLFKTVVTTAAFEMADFDATMPVGLTGGCAHVRETGEWLKEHEPTDLNRMSLRKAFGSSCNGFFAKIAVNNLGLGIITDFARRYGWETGVPVDFALDKSPFHPPAPQNSSTSTVGRFAAGFGYVGLSAVHAAWIMLTIANDGASLPIRLFRDSSIPQLAPDSPRIFSERTAKDLHAILDSSVKSGTATVAFRRGKYRKLQDLVGGKTGTLTGSSPKGLTTWFAGMAPVESPEIVVASVVVLDERWHIKGPNLAAEGIWAYFDGKLKEKASAPVSLLPPVAAGEAPAPAAAER